MIEKIKQIKKHGVINSMIAFLDKTATYKAIIILTIAIIYLFING